MKILYVSMIRAIWDFRSFGMLHLLLTFLGHNAALWCTVPKIWFMYSQKLTVRPCSQFLHSCICDRYIFPGSVCLFSCSKIDRMILGIYKSFTDTWMWKLADRILKFCFRNNEAAQFHFWEYINWNQTFLLASHRPFICSVLKSCKESQGC